MFLFLLQKFVHFLKIIISKHLLIATRDNANMSARKVAIPEPMMISHPCFPKRGLFDKYETPRGNVIRVQCNKSTSDKCKINTVVVSKFASSPCRFLLAARGIVMSVARFPRIPKVPINVSHTPVSPLIISAVLLYSLKHSYDDKFDPLVQISFSRCTCSAVLQRVFAIMLYFASLGLSDN